MTLNGKEWKDPHFQSSGEGAELLRKYSPRRRQSLKGLKWCGLTKKDARRQLQTEEPGLKSMAGSNER